eukprot:1157296-Prymnesium_polylepis.1
MGWGHGWAAVGWGRVRALGQRWAGAAVGMGGGASPPRPGRRCARRALPPCRRPARDERPKFGNEGGVG